MINLAPGPAMFYVMNQSLKYGIKAGLKAAAGVEFGVFFYVLLSAFGLMFVFQQIPLLYKILQFTGALYLLYLAYVAWPKRKAIKSSNVPSQNSTESTRYSFSKGMLINLSNQRLVSSLLACYHNLYLRILIQLGYISYYMAYYLTLVGSVWIWL